MRWLLVALLLLAAVAGAAWATGPGWSDTIPVVLGLLDRLPPSCDHAVGRWAGFVQDALPADCADGLAEGPRSVALLQVLVEDEHRPMAVRTAAVRRLVADEADPRGYVDGLVRATATPPDLRRELFRSRRADAREGEWADLAVGVAVHGLYDEGVLLSWEAGATERAADVAGMMDLGLLTGAHGLDRVLDGLGWTRAEMEEAVARHARGQSALGVPPAWRDELWRHDCADGCVALVRALLEREAPAEAPEIPAELELLYPVGRAADHVAAELDAVGAWVAAGRPEERLDRALLRVVEGERGDPHEALHQGSGDPGAVAWLLHTLGERVGVSVAVSWDEGVRVGLGGDTWRLRSCGGAAPGSEAGRVSLGPSALGALVLSESAGSALRRGDLERAGELLGAAVARAPDVAPLRRARAVHAALAAARLVAPPDRSFVPNLAAPPRSRGRFPVVILDPRLAVAAENGGRTLDIQAASAEAADHVVAAWWALQAGHPEVARALLPGPLTGYPEALRLHLARALGEPAAAPAPAERPCDALGLWPELPA